MLWYILCQNFRFADSDNFIDTFDLSLKEEKDLAITLVYFTFTSLSTVGLGDLHPRSNIERMVGALVLLFGVALTSYIMETLSTMLGKITNLNKGFC